VLTFDGDRISTIEELHDSYGLLVQLDLAE